MSGKPWRRRRRGWMGDWLRAALSNCAGPWHHDMAPVRVPWQSGLTLVELLAVTALLAIVVSLGAGRLQAAGTRSALDQAVERLQNWDARERWRAGLQGGRKWRLHASGAELAEPAQADDTPDKQQLRLPQGVRCQWQDDAGTTVEALPYSDSGCSADLRVELWQDGDQRRYRLLGLSGQWLAE